MIVIIGAGLTGLSVAYHMKNRPYMIFEQEEKPGGLCRTAEVDEFLFDFTGHLLHIKDPATKRFLNRILPGTLSKVFRNAAVSCRGTYLPYPFQANTYGLPEDVVYECVMGFVEAHMKKRGGSGSSNFRDWVVKTFGDGIAKYFFIPYNEKLWLTDLRNLTTDWADWSIPRPTLQEVIGGSLGIKNTGLGYNASFYYPEKGGIQVLIDAIGQYVKNIHTCKELISINLKEKLVAFQDKEQVPYDTLVSTIPLPRLLSMIEDLPYSYKNASQNLRSVSVQNLNLGINRERVSDYHWIYFPEREYPFYRVGFYSNISDSMAPKKTSSMYIEIASSPQKKKKYETVLEESMEGLKRCGILKKGDKIIASNYAEIDCGYVVFDKHRKKTVPDILRYLKRRGVLSAGRYGSWTYSSMEDALIQGKEIAGFLK